jgi:UDPglucose--hexose-1-phosphate uridylyltransferase
MSELRRDPILRRWVIMAPERAAEIAMRRPPPRAEAPDGPCPFCPGSEHLNPRAIAVVPEGGPWRVRVTPDKRPLLRVEGDLGRRGAGMFDVMNAIGAHELVSDTSHHAQSWADFSRAQMAELLATYRARIRDLAGDRRFRHAIVLKNHGAAWSHFAHAHSHVIATPFTPRRLEEELAGAREYHRMRERCPFCDQIQEELRTTTRLIGRNADFISFAPFASEFPYETWIAPLEHWADFATLPDAALEPLGDLLIDALGRLRVALADPPHSVVLHAGALDGGDQAEFHWHWEIVPHLGSQLGMEWATGIYSNPVPPEDAAAALRAATPA